MIRRLPLFAVFVCLLFAKVSIAQIKTIHEDFSVHPKRATVVRPVRNTVSKTSENNPYTFHKRLGFWSLAATYATTVLTAAAMDDGFIGTTALPVAGPWITMARVESDPTGSYQDGGKPLLAASGLLQGGLLVYTLVSWNRESTYARHVGIAPTLGRPGFAVAVTF